MKLPALSFSGSVAQRAIDGDWIHSRSATTWCIIFADELRDRNAVLAPTYQQPDAPTILFLD